VHLNNEKYGKDVDFILPVEERDKLHRYIPNKLSPQLEIVKVESNKNDSTKWIVYCRES
jgi:hypothetical protein